MFMEGEGGRLFHDKWSLPQRASYLASLLHHTSLPVSVPLFLHDSLLNPPPAPHTPFVLSLSVTFSCSFLPSPFRVWFSKAAAHPGCYQVFAPEHGW